MKTSRTALTALCLALLAGVATTADAPQWNEAKPGYLWEFPRDHWSHAGYRTEWWYFTGQLATAGRVESWPLSSSCRAQSHRLT